MAEYKRVEPYCFKLRQKITELQCVDNEDMQSLMPLTPFKERKLLDYTGSEVGAIEKHYPLIVCPKSVCQPAPMYEAEGTVNAGSFGNALDIIVQNIMPVRLDFVLLATYMPKGTRRAYTWNEGNLRLDISNGKIGREFEPTEKMYKMFKRYIDLCERETGQMMLQEAIRR